MNPQNLTSFSDISFIFSVLYKLPPAVLCKTPTSRRPDYLLLHKRRQPRTIPRPALPHTRLMNALFVLRPAKLWAFNIGHPCPSLAKGSWLAARLAFIKYSHSSRHPQRPKLHKPYLPSRLRDRRPDYLHLRKHH